MSQLSQTKHKILQDVQTVNWEDVCGNCGACCGVVEGDPCENLVKLKDDKYLCSVYERRFIGMHKSIKGAAVKCVPISKILSNSWPGHQDCQYKKDF